MSTSRISDAMCYGIHFKVTVKGLDDDFFTSFVNEHIKSFNTRDYRVVDSRHVEFTPVFKGESHPRVTLQIGDTLAFDFEVTMWSDGPGSKVMGKTRTQMIFELRALPYPREHESPSEVHINVDLGVEKDTFWCDKFMKDTLEAYTRKMHRDINDALAYDLRNGIRCRCGPTQSPTPKPMDILKEADKTVNSDRQGEYGDPVENAVRAALVATATQGKAITPEDIIQVMHSQKMVRSGRSHKTDTNVDQAGYAEIRERVQKAVKDGTVQKIVEKLLGGWVKFNPEPKPEKYGSEVARGVLKHTTLRNSNSFLSPSYDLDITLATKSFPVIDAGANSKAGYRYALVEVKA